MGTEFIEEVILTLTLSRAGLRGLLARVIGEEAGQGLSEYALILFFIAVVAIAALTFLGSDISSLLSRVANSL
jgi:Flp pilus assembly pilin Flp